MPWCIHCHIYQVCKPKPSWPVWCYEYHLCSLFSDFPDCFWNQRNWREQVSQFEVPFETESICSLCAWVKLSGTIVPYFAILVCRHQIDVWLTPSLYQFLKYSWI
ncbi:hypothetical protein FKM82_020690 [Ascaphus truei]